MTTRATTTGGQLARLGFADPGRAERLLQDSALAGFADPLDEVFHDGLPDALSAAADPDLALLGLVRVLDALPDDERAGVFLALRRQGPARPLPFVGAWAR